MLYGMCFKCVVSTLKCCTMTTCDVLSTMNLEMCIPAVLEISLSQIV